MTGPRQTIAILGGDISGPMAAAFLSHHLVAQHFEIVFIRPRQLERPVWFASAHSDLRRFHRELKLGEGQFVTHCAASFKLGETYAGYAPTPYVLPYAEYGTSVNGVSFFNVQRAAGALHNLSDQEPYCFPIAAGRAGKFLPPDAQGRPILADFDYGYHFNVSRYAELLTELAVKNGARVINSDSAKVIRDGDKITALTLETGETIAADIFIDSSGTQRTLSEAADYDDWSEYGFTQSHSAYSQDTSDLSLFTEFSAKLDGWDMTASAQLGTDRLACFFDPDAGKQRHKIGRLLNPWHSNVLSLGLATAELEPTASLPLRAIQLDLERFLRVIPGQLDKPIIAQEYNRLAKSAYERMRDYQLLQYATAPAWHDRKMTLPETVLYKKRLFASRGRVPLLDDDQMFQDQWAPMLVGNGVIPARIDLLAQQISETAREEVLKPYRDFVRKTVERMPSQREFIVKNCAAPGFAEKVAS